MLPHERLKAWELCHRLWLEVFRASLAWPPAERYGLTAQIKRAALFPAANIAEGAAKRGSREFARHLNIAIGSLAEVAYLLRAAHDAAIVDRGEFDRLFELQQQASRLTMLLYKAIRRSARNQAG